MDEIGKFAKPLCKKISLAIFSGQSVKFDFKEASVFTNDLHLSMGKFKVGYCFTD